MGKTVNEIKLDELSVTLIRDRMPRNMFKEIERLGGKVVRKHKGVYHIKKMSPIPTQFIMTRELKPKYRSLRGLTSRATKNDITALANLASAIKDKPMMKNMNALLQVCIEANKEVADEALKNAMQGGKKKMCEALRPYFQEELDKERDDGRVETIRYFMAATGYAADQVLNMTGFSKEDREKYAELLKNN